MNHSQEDQNEFIKQIGLIFISCRLNTKILILFLTNKYPLLNKNVKSS